MATRSNLDLDTLRTFAVAYELGGLTQAAKTLGRTPSAISLQMKRLQEDLGTPLFRKAGRGLTLTEAGEIALTYARRILAMHDELQDTMQGANLAGHIRIGCAQDFTPILPSALSHFASIFPRMQVELFIEGNAALADAVGKGRIDLAIAIGHEDRPTAQVVGQVDLVWIASSTFTPPQHQPLPLAVLGPQCAFRKCAIQHLEEGRTPYRVAANSPSLDGLWVALLAGLGVTARPALNLPEGLVSASSLHGLPFLGQVPLTLHRNPHSDSEAVNRMAALLSQSIQVMLITQSKGNARHGSVGSGNTFVNISSRQRNHA